MQLAFLSGADFNKDGGERVKQNGGSGFKLCETKF